MDSAELLNATINFSVAQHRYATLIARAFINEGRFNSSITDEDLQRIRDAKRESEIMEERMYAVWEHNGIGSEEPKPIETDGNP